MAIEITSEDIFTPEKLKSHFKIYAGPGAGKTHFLVENVKNIVTQNSAIVESRSRKVLCVTYTNAAVDEIKKRLDKFTDCVDVCTIHGFIIEHIIQPFQQDLISLMESDFGISVRAKGKITSQIEGLGILHGIDKNEIYEYVKKLNPSEFSSDVFDYSKKAMGEIQTDNNSFADSVIKGETRQVKLKAPSKIAECHIIPLKQYVWSVVRKLTHDEVLYFGYRILETNPTALYAIRVKFPFIFVDEFQDTNPIQTLLIKLIGQRSTIVGVIGDIAQSIYSFQGARPTDFGTFSIEGQRPIEEYVINRNRRSTANIVNLCNFLRQSDNKVKQVSKRAYNSEDEKAKAEAKKIHFLIGSSQNVQGIIQAVIQDGGVVLTRAWAAAFDYIRDIDDEQSELLKSIYSSYRPSPIQLRDEIVEHNNVTWVRAFRFIFMLWEGYLNGSFIDILRSLQLYGSIDPQKITPKVIYQIGKISKDIFSTIGDDTCTVSIIEAFNSKIKEQEYIDLRKAVFDDDFEIPLFDEYDDSRRDLINGLHWGTSHKLFTEVFSEDSKYMTVHQAKGLEWDKVIVSVTPNKFDKIKLSALFSRPQLIDETPSDEFTRMYYVACSRAKEDLYIHIKTGCSSDTIETAIASFVAQTKMQIAYEIVS
ncbi:UvrD-helicase domain-containing protein [uncultured Flavonifractor sp.]|uniref:DNA 3'-5' helicase n=1 Tax=Candidatus Flavonifractor intestinigallinarum TaxID=2838586 RepID=A0A9D2MLT1_9FIRM|nr:ATP-dependent helicase [uncultured Flavonifractor sp.]HJB80080.1 ATP-dependent helicase [Candidatus Flavonifractor intestinigallinarum]